MTDLAVITSAKKLGEYILTIIQKSPAKYRHSYVDLIINTQNDIIENLYLANQMELGMKERFNYQSIALAKLKLLDYYCEASRKVDCITFPQYQNVAKYIYECIKLLNGWINSDKKRNSNNSDGVAL